MSLGGREKALLAFIPPIPAPYHLFPVLTPSPFTPHTRLLYTSRDGFVVS